MSANNFYSIVILLIIVSFSSCIPFPGINPNDSNIIVNQINSQWNIDIDADGNNEFYIFSDFQTCSGGGGVTLESGNFNSDNSNEVLVSFTIGHNQYPILHPTVLKYNQVIYTTLLTATDWNSVADLYSYATCDNINFDLFENDSYSIGPIYFGVRFTIDDNYHYGWIEFINERPTRAAYNSVPGLGLRIEG